MTKNDTKAETDEQPNTGSSGPSRAKRMRALEEQAGIMGVPRNGGVQVYEVTDSGAPLRFVDAFPNKGHVEAFARGILYERTRTECAKKGTTTTGGGATESVVTKLSKGPKADSD